MPSTHNQTEQLYLETSFFRRLNAFREEVMKPGGQSQLVILLVHVCQCIYDVHKTEVPIINH